MFIANLWTQELKHITNNASKFLKKNGVKQEQIQKVIKTINQLVKLYSNKKNLSVKEQLQIENLVMTLHNQWISVIF